MTIEYLNIDIANQYVYFIANLTTNSVKIGYTTNHPTHRLKQLQTANDTPLYLLKYIKATKVIESMYHKALYKYHTDSNNEWFRLVPEVIMFCQLDETLNELRSTLENTTVTNKLNTSKYTIPYELPKITVTYHSELLDDSFIDDSILLKYM